MVRIRLTRVGATKQPTYRFVVADSRSARDGRALDTLGHYNPRQEPVEINVDAEKAARWLSQGAQPSDTVARLFRQVGILPAGLDAVSAAELVTLVAKSLVHEPDAVAVEVHDDEGTQVIELHVSEEDMGKVIGRNGSVAKAMRTLLKVVATREGSPIALEIV